jgi:hypothetical protein
MVPAVSIPPLLETTPASDVAPPPESPKRGNAEPQKAVPDRQRRSNRIRKEKRALTELMGLIGPSDEPSFIRSFESFQSCRQYVAINC